MSYQGPQGYRQPDVYDYPVPDGDGEGGGEQLDGTVGYAELTAYRRAGYPGYGDFQAPPVAREPLVSPESPASPGQPAFRGRLSGPFPDTAGYQRPDAYQPPAPPPRVAPGRRSNVSTAVNRPAPTYLGPESDEFAAPVINPAPVDAPPASHGRQDHAGGGGLAAMAIGLLSAAVAISGSVLAAMLLRPLRSPVSRRHRVAGVIGIIAFFGAAAGFVAATRPGGHAADVVPSLAGGVAGAVALLVLASVLLGPARRARRGRRA